MPMRSSQLIKLKAINSATMRQRTQVGRGFGGSATPLMIAPPSAFPCHGPLDNETPARWACWAARSWSPFFA